MNFRTFIHDIPYMAKLSIAKTITVFVNFTSSANVLLWILTVFLFHMPKCFYIRSWWCAENNVEILLGTWPTMSGPLYIYTHCKAILPVSFFSQTRASFRGWRGWVLAPLDILLPPLNYHAICLHTQTYALSLPLLS